MAKQGFELEPAWIEACEGLTTLLDTQEVQYAHYRPVAIVIIILKSKDISFRGS